MHTINLIHEAQQDVYLISTDPAKLNLEIVHDYLTNVAYWCLGIPRSKVEKFVRHSLCYGVYKENQQIGFARVITDYTTYAYLCDVFILPAHQGHGLGSWLVKTILQHPELRDLRSWNLKTNSAQELYRKFGFYEKETMEYRPNG